MNTPKAHSQTPLQQAAQIAHLERGKLSIIRQGPDGPFYNHQYRHNGKNITRYVPRDQVAAVQKAIDGYGQFRQLIEQHVDQLVQSTRREITDGSKKKPTPSRPGSCSPRKQKSGS